MLGPATRTAVVVGESDPKFFSYDFRLRWFRLRITLAGDEPIVTCWAEGLLRGGGGGLWQMGGGGPTIPAGEFRDVRNFPGRNPLWQGLPPSVVAQLEAQQGRAAEAQWAMQAGVPYSQVNPYWLG